MIKLKLIDPSSTALLVVDKQAGYLDQTLVEKRSRSLPSNASEVLKAIDDFIKLCRNHKVPIIWTKMVEDPELSPSRIKDIMPASLSITKPGEPSFEIVGLQPLENETVIVKSFYNAFVNTELAKLLDSLKIKSVIFIGGYASRCVLATIVGASGLGHICIVPKGLVISQQSDAGEIDLLYNIVLDIFGYVVDVEEITACWQESK